MTTRPFVPRASRVLSDAEREQTLAVLAVAFKIIGNKAPDEMVLKPEDTKVGQYELLFHVDGARLSNAAAATPT